MEHTLNAFEDGFDHADMDGGHEMWLEDAYGHSDEPEDQNSFSAQSQSDKPARGDERINAGAADQSTFDERYSARDQTILYDMLLSADKLLSHELGDDRYRVHKPEQQQRWGFLKWEAQKRLAQLVFTFKTPWLFLKSELGGDVVLALPELNAELLMDLGDDDEHADADPDDISENRKINKKKKLVGVAVSGATGVRVNFSPSAETYSALVQLIDAFMAGNSRWTRSELVEMLTEDYHLSYCHFIRGHAARLIKAVSDLSQASMADQESFAASEGLTWQQCSNLRRLMMGEHYTVISNRNRLVETNIRAALHVASQRYRISGGSKPCMERLDLVTEACLGLMHAADLYIPKCTARFTTYAMNWMNQKAGRYIKNNNSIRLPLHISEQIVCITSAVMSMVRECPEFTHEQLPKKEDVEAFLGRKKGRRVVISALLWKLSDAKLRGLPFCVGGLDLNGGLEFQNEAFSSEMNEETDAKRDMKRMVDQIFSSDKLTDLQKQILRYSIMEPDAIEDLPAHLGIKKEKLRSERKIALKKAGGILREMSIDVSRFFSDDYEGLPNASVSASPSEDDADEAGSDVDTQEILDSSGNMQMQHEIKPGEQMKLLV